MVSVGMTPVPFDQPSADFLAPALGDDLEEVRGECQRDEATLVKLSGAASGMIITRIEQYPDGLKELVVVAGRGRNMAAVIETLTAICRKNAISSIRVHSSRKGYQRLVEPMGFELIECRSYESVYRLKV